MAYKKKIIARYFYSPICPEAFASLDRIRALFEKHTEDIEFQSFNVVNISPNNWFPNELKLIDSICHNGQHPLLFGQLFIEGIEVKGFPPSKKHIESILKDYQIRLKDDAYVYSYCANVVVQQICDINRFKIDQLGKLNLRDTSMICTKFNPYLDEKSYSAAYWSKYENLKMGYISENLDNDTLIGCVEYYDSEPVGFIEVFPLKISRRLGFPVSGENDDGVMITCLSVRKEFSGYGVASRLIKSAELEVQKKNYHTIEVLAFPDNRNWHPKSLYAKKGYVEVRTIMDLCIMKKNLVK